MTLPSFTVDPDGLLELLGNISGGEIVGNGLTGATPATPATVTFVSNVPAGHFVKWDGILYAVDEVTATVNSDGQILRNGAPVQLLANDDGLSVQGLQWQVHATGMKRFWFNAPTDGGTVDLGTVAPVPGLGANGVAFSEGELVTLLSDGDSAVREALDALYVGGGGGGGITTAGIHAATSKATPVDADELALVDSAASFGLKKLTWANLKAAIKSYYDAVTSTLTNKDLTSGTNTFPTFNQNTTGSAAKWTTARTVQTNLASTSAASVDGSANVTPGVTGVLPMANGGTGAALTDPNADRIPFWDDSAGAMVWLTPGTNLSITGTTIDASGGGGSGDVTGQSSSVDSEVVLFSGTTGKAIKRASISGLAKLVSGVLSAAVAGTDYVAPGGALGTPSSGTATNLTGLPVSGIAASTSAALGVGSVELGHASDTTMSRAAAGEVAIEGVRIAKVSDTPRFLKWSGTAWPDRPADSRMTFFIGGSAATDAPADADLTAGDVWIPATA